MEEKYDFKEEKLSNYILDIAAGPFGSNLKVECFVPHGFPIIDGANLKCFKVTDNVTKFVTEEKARSLHRSIAKRNDVIVTISGNVGQISYIPMDSKYSEYLVSQRQFRVTFDTTKVYVPYLVYYFHTKEGQHKILSFANQTGVPALAQPLKNFKNIDIFLPDFLSQKRIAKFLSALDDKIELNRRINDNLEQQAQALFDDMFFNNVELERYNLSNYADINPFRSIKKDTEARFIEMSNLPTQGSFPLNWDFKHYNGGMKFSNGDTIMARITPCLENGKTAYIDFLDDNEVAFGSTEYIVFSAKNGYCPALFYYLARNQEFIDYAISHMNGSSGRQRVSGNDIANFPMPNISKESSDEFGKIVMPIMSIIRDNSIMNRSLAQLRDSLLSRLMSGELKINDLNC